MHLHQSGCVAILWLSCDTSCFNLQLECINKVKKKNTNKHNKKKEKKKLWINNYNNTAYWSTIGSIYFSIKIVSPVRIFGNLGCFSTLITVPTCKVISVHMSFEHCKGLVPGLYVDILKVFCTAGSQCNSLFLTTADCCSKEKVFSPVFWQIFQLFEHFKPNFEIILVPP